MGNEMDDEQLDILVNQKEIVLAKFIELLDDISFASSIKAGDKYSLVILVDKTKRMLKEILDDRKYTTKKF